MKVNFCSVFFQRFRKSFQKKKKNNLVFECYGVGFKLVSVSQVNNTKMFKISMKFYIKKYKQKYKL